MCVIQQAYDEIRAVDRRLRLNLRLLHLILLLACPTRRQLTIQPSPLLLELLLELLLTMPCCVPAAVANNSTPHSVLSTEEAAWRVNEPLDDQLSEQLPCRVAQLYALPPTF